MGSNGGELDLPRLVQINESQIKSELASCPAYFYMVANLSVEAEALYEETSLALSVCEAEIGPKIKADNEDDTKKEMTQTELKRLFTKDPEWLKIKHLQLKRLKNFKLMEKAAKALDMKSRLLTSINRRDLHEKGIKGSFDD